jgi:hypothetical protein
MKVFSGAAAIIFLLTLNATVETTNALPEAEIEGQQLAKQLCEMQPGTNFDQTGTLQIRAKGQVEEIPIRIKTSVSAADWSVGYQILKPNYNDWWFITHSANQPNRYDFEDVKQSKHPKLSPTALTEIKTVRAMTNSFAGSDFWLGDLGLEFFHWPDQKILKHEMRRGRACQVLESTNPDPTTNSYSRVVSWIDNETLGIVQAEAYDAKGELLKEFYPKSFKKVNGQWELQEMEIRNDQTGSRTRLKFDLNQRD